MNPTSQLNEMCRRASSRSVTFYSHFLNLAEQKEGLIAARREGLFYTLWGGAEGAERCILAVSSEQEPDRFLFPLSCLLIAPRSARFSGPLAHRDVLGSLMALGITREQLGDIVLREEGAYLFCLDKMASFIADSLDAVGGTPVKCSMTDAPQGELRKTQLCRLQVASPRADAIVAHLFRLSRADAQELFRREKVTLDDAPCLRTDTILQEGQVLSVRGFGRARYDGVENLSKKGKYNLLISLYS